MPCVTRNTVHDDLRWKISGGGRMGRTDRQTVASRTPELSLDDLLAGSEDLISATTSDRDSRAHDQRQPGVRRCAERFGLYIAHIAGKY